MRRVWIRSTALVLLLMSVFCGSLAEDFVVPLVSVTESTSRQGIGSDGLIPWGNGFLSFSVILASGDQGCSDGVTASVSYYAKNGKTSEEVLGWELVLNDCDDCPVSCVLWYVFPDGQQANYTNPKPVSFHESLCSCRITPLLADELPSDKFPAVTGSTAEVDQESDRKEAGAATALNSGLVSCVSD